VLSSISWTKLRSDVLTAMLGRGGVMIVGFITTLLLTRVLPISDVGVYFIVLSVVLILGPLANLGLQEPTVRAIASLVATHDHARASGVAKCALRVAVTSAGIVSITVLLTWTALSESELVLAKENLLTGVFVAAWIGTIAVEAQLVGTLQGLEKIGLAVLFDGALAKLLAALGIGALYLSNGYASLHEVLFVFVASETANTLIAGFCVHFLLGLSRADAPGVSAAELLKIARPFLLHQLTALVASQGDAIVLGLLRPAAEVAQFGTAMRLSSLLALPAAAANVPIAPSIAKLQAQHRRPELEKMLQMSAAVSTAMAVLMTLIFTASGELVLSRFFGAAYAAGAATLAILCVGQCINLAMGQCLVALAMSGEQAVGTRIAVWSSIIKLVLVIVFGYLLGALGVAIASAIATSVAKVAAWSAARRRLNIDTRARLALVGDGLKYVYQTLNGYIQRR
jgi:O-antigen/teichoic acid export membrane protein